MIVVCCECDWGLGKKLPPHTHTDKELLRLRDGRELWMTVGVSALNPDMQVLAEWPEISFSVDWKALYRQEAA
jgi:hypothetical protein